MSNIAKPVTICLVASILSILAPVAMACDAPVFNHNIPDGVNASQEQMDEIYKLVNEYVKSGEEYIECVAQSEGRTMAERIRHDMLDSMERVAARFNRELRAFRRANS